MKRLILLALLVVAFVAMPAFASVQNVKVSGDVDNTWIIRNRFDLGTDLTQSKQNLGILQADVKVSADLTDNVGAVVKLIDESVWGGTSNAGNVSLDLAYATFKEFLYSPLTVTVGRQGLHYGNGLIVGDPNTNNQASSGRLGSVAADLSKEKAFDAVKLSFDYHPLVIDVVGAKINSRSNALSGATTDGTKDDTTLLGVNANYELGDKWGVVFNPYFFAKIDQSGGISGLTQSANEGSKSDTVYATGILASLSPIKGLMTSLEVAHQAGTKNIGATDDAIRRDAWATQFMANYAIQSDNEKVQKMKPVIGGSYTVLTGDKTPGTVGGRGENKYAGWDPMFEDQHGGTIVNSIFDLTDARIAAISISASPLEDLMARFTWINLALDKKIDTGSAGHIANLNRFTIRQPDSATGLTTADLSRKKDLGNEYDANLTYQYTEDVQFGLNLGWYVPGAAFVDVNRKTASQILLNADVAF